MRTLSPVSSREVADFFNHSISSSSIRNHMQILGKNGLLIGSSCSGGKTPSDISLNNFVNNKSFYQGSSCGTKKSKSILIRELHKIIEEKSELEKCTILATIPKIYIDKIDKIKIVGITEFECTIIAISDSGLFTNVIYSLDTAMDQRDWHYIEFYVNNKLNGGTETISKVFSQKIEDAAFLILHKIYCDCYLNNLSCGIIPNKSKLFGERFLFNTQNQNDKNFNMTQVINMYENTDSIIKTIMHFKENSRALIGNYFCTIDGLVFDQMSIIFKKYKSNGILGAVAVIGHKIMDYDKAKRICSELTEQLEYIFDSINIYPINGCDQLNIKYLDKIIDNNNQKS